GLDEEIALLGAVSADLAERDLQFRGANAGGFGQDVAEIAFAQGEAAEFRKRRQPAQKPLDLFDGIAISGIRCIGRGRRLEDMESVRERPRRLAGADDLLDEL